MNEIYDTVIIGGGPAGMAAGIYCGRARMNALILEKAACGGQALVADIVENLPGFPDGIKGPEAAERMLSQAKNCGIKIENTEAKEIILKKKRDEPFVVKLDQGARIKAVSLIVATGARWNALGIPGEKGLTGRGVSYCATCDGPLFKNKEVVVVGGGDTALEDALFLAKFARKVTIVHRRDKLRATKILQERAFKNSKIEFCLNSIVGEILGKSKVEGARLKDVRSGKESILKSDGVFIFIGITPNSEIVKDVVKLDERGYIISDNDMCTSENGIFACGDVRKKALRQIVTAIGEGASAAFSAVRYVEHIKGIEYKEY